MCVVRLSQHHGLWQEGDSAVQELLQLGFIDPVTSASAGKRYALIVDAWARLAPSLFFRYLDELALQISQQMAEEVRKIGGALPLVDLYVRVTLLLQSRSQFQFLIPSSGFAPTITNGRWIPSAPKISSARARV